jgi:hypothetical protein
MTPIVDYPAKNLETTHHRNMKIEKALIEWKSLKVKKGQTMQQYTDGFQKWH